MDDNVVSVLRMLERLLVVGFGGLAIYLGYKLFFHLPHQTDHAGKLTLPGMKIVLSRVGPGIFFLAFGATILLHNLDSPIKVKTDNHALQGQITEVSKSFLGAVDVPRDSDDQGIVQRRVAAIEYVGELNCLIKTLEARKIKIPATIRIAHHAAKLALLRPVWNKQAWGDPTALENDSEPMNNNLKGVFDDVSVSCQYQSH